MTNIRFDIKPVVDDGYIEIASFYINEDEKLKSKIPNEIPIEMVVECLKQWIDAQSKKRELVKDNG